MLVNLPWQWNDKCKSSSLLFAAQAPNFLSSAKVLVNSKHTSTNVVIVILFYMSEKLYDLIDVQCNSKILTNQYLENMNHGLIFISAVELSMKDQRCCSIENSRRRIQNKVCPLLTWRKRTLKNHWSCFFTEYTSILCLPIHQDSWEQSWCCCWTWIS